MSLTYIASGGAKLGGCATVRVIANVVTTFNVGDTLYLAYKARSGCLETVTLKALQFPSRQRTFGQLVALYVDTLNGLYNESDLCTRDEADTLVAAYQARQRASLADAIRNCLI